MKTEAEDEALFLFQMPGFLVMEQAFAVVFGGGYFPVMQPDRLVHRLKVAVGVGVAAMVCCLAYVVFGRAPFDEVAFLALLLLVYLIAFSASCYVTRRNRQGSLFADGGVVGELVAYSVLRQNWGHEFRYVKITHEATDASLSFVCLTETFNDFRVVSVFGDEFVFDMPASRRSVKRLRALSKSQHQNLRVLADNVENDDRSYVQAAGTSVVRCAWRVG